MSAWGQNQPLPPGWEAKYDPNSARYFFINHQTRETTWNDPRTNYSAYSQPQYGGYRQQQYYQQQQQAYQASQAAQALRTQREPSPVTTSYQMTETRVDSESESEDETSLGGDLMGDLVSDSEKQRLLNSIKNKMDLVGVSDDLIITTLDASAYKEDMAISMFESMGFHLKGQSGSSDQTSNRWEVGGSSSTSYEEREAERERKEEAERKKREEERKKREREEAERREREEAEKRRKEEEEEEKKRKQEAEKKRKAEAEKKRKAEALRKAKTERQEQEDKAHKLDDMQAMLDQAMADLGAKFDKQKKKSPKKTTTTRPAQSSSVLDAHKKKSNKPVFTPTENQGLKAARGADGLLIRMRTEGNDPSLVNGSNADALRTERLDVQGPDRSLAVGRQRGLAKGRSRDLAVGRSCAAMGADPNLRHGADPRLNNGPARFGQVTV